MATTSRRAICLILVSLIGIACRVAAKDQPSTEKPASRNAKQPQPPAAQATQKWLLLVSGQVNKSGSTYLFSPKIGALRPDLGPHSVPAQDSRRPAIRRRSSYLFVVHRADQPDEVFDATAMRNLSGPEEPCVVVESTDRHDPKLSVIELDSMTIPVDSKVIGLSFLIDGVVIKEITEISKLPDNATESPDSASQSRPSEPILPPDEQWN